MKCPFLEMLIFSSLNGICQFKNGIIGSFCVGLGATLSRKYERRAYKKIGKEYLICNECIEELFKK